LVVAREGFEADLGESRQVAEWIPGARFVVLPGRDRPWISDVQDRLLQELRAFVAEVRDQEAELDRVLATVLFTDIVNSTGQSAVMGDRRWQTIRAEHDRIVRASVARYRGKALKTLGDGFLATFDGPARGVHCARAISLAVRSLGIEVRAGLHTGEVELDGDDVAGIAVVIGARVAALAAPSEVLVSRTVKDLVAGSGLAFEDRGAHPLKGVPDEWHLYAVASGQA
jgi:class 3 adenylate cyclase